MLYSSHVIVQRAKLPVQLPVWALDGNEALTVLGTPFTCVCIIVGFSPCVSF